LSLYQAYVQGQTITLDLPPSYRDYIAWLQTQDLTQAETFWRGLLADFTTPTSLPLRPTPQLTPATATQQQIKLSAQNTQALQTLVRQHQLTLNTIVQGIWGLLLSHYSHSTEVVFGATVSGRSPELRGADAMIGLFINSLPVRVQLSPMLPLIPWLKEIQEQQVEARQYEYTPLNKIQEWSDIKPGLPLFETLVVFENYPVANDLGSIPLEIKDISFAISNNYPLTFRVVPGEELSLFLMYDKEKFSPQGISPLLNQIQQLLTQLIKIEATAPVSELVIPLTQALESKSLKKLKRIHRKTIRKPIA
jgi:non-ribosomal peptide synthetase component F